MAKTAPKKSKGLHKLAKKSQREVFEKMDSLLKRLGVSGNVTAVEVTLEDAPAAEPLPTTLSSVAGPMAAVGRSICRKLPNGVIVCTGG